MDANDTDPEGNNPVTVMPGSLTGDGAGFTTLLANYYGHVNKYLEITAPNVSTRTFYTVNYTAQDSLGATATDTLTIDVRAFGNLCS